MVSLESEQFKDAIEFSDRYFYMWGEKNMTETIKWVIEIDPEYAFSYEDYEDYEEDVDISAARNPYKKLASNANPEYSDFIEFIKDYCELYGLTFEYEVDRLPNGSLSRYLYFYNFNNETNNKVNLIIEVRVSDHYYKAQFRGNELTTKAKRKYKKVRNQGKIKLSKVNIIFDGKHCHSYDDALDLLQVRLEQIDNRFHFYNELDTN